MSDRNTDFAHGGVAVAGAIALLSENDPAAVERGLANLEKHVGSIGYFREPPVVVLNGFATDTEEGIGIFRQRCEELGVPFAVTDHYTRGGEGATGLARTVLENAEPTSH